MCVLVLSRVFVCGCMRACVFACAGVCVCVCVGACVGASSSLQVIYCLKVIFHYRGCKWQVVFVVCACVGVWCAHLLW